MAEPIDVYAAVASETRASIKVQRSEFIGIAFPATTESDVQAKLASVQKEFFDATHHCWAYRLLAGGEIRAHGSDAGEPSGTAGKPIANALVSADLLDAAVIVVRYYGGVKLGTGGLARAYRDSADAVLAEAPRRVHYVYDRVRVEAPFSSMNNVYRMIAPPDIVLAGESFGDRNEFLLDVRKSKTAGVLQHLHELRLTASIVSSTDESRPSSSS